MRLAQLALLVLVLTADLGITERVYATPVDDVPAAGARVADGNLQAFKGNYSRWLTATGLDGGFQLMSVKNVDGSVRIDVLATAELSDALKRASYCSPSMAISDAAGRTWRSADLVERLELRAASLLDLPFQHVRVRINLRAGESDRPLLCWFDATTSTCETGTCMVSANVTLSSLVISPILDAAARVRHVSDKDLRKALLRAARALVAHASAVEVEDGKSPRPGSLAVKITGRGILTKNNFEELELFFTYRSEGDATDVFCVIDGDSGVSIVGTGRPTDMRSMEPDLSKGMSEFCTRLIGTADDYLSDTNQ